VFAQFVERVPMVKGRLDRKATTATGYAWFVWEHGHAKSAQLVWIPPCRKLLEKHADYKTPTHALRHANRRPDRNPSGQLLAAE
jgi:hypothetical protein